jgi:acetyl esterase/lipase
MKKIPVWFGILCLFFTAPLLALEGYKTEFGIVYAKIGSKELIINAFIPEGVDKPTAAMVEIHGGWWSSGKPETRIEYIGGAGQLVKHKVALFTISYRLGKEGGFPENIRDCRNAIRYIRKNAAKFNIDPERIGCMGGSAGSHLSEMCAMVPEDFEDGGPTEELKGVSAKVCNAFSVCGPVDFVAQWNEAPSDEVKDADGKITYRPADSKIPHDARPRHRILHKGVTPETEAGKAQYMKMSPMGHVRKDVAPILIVDGLKDDVVPLQHGKRLHEALDKVGAENVYFAAESGHAYPRGNGFEKVLEDFFIKTLKLK